MNILDKYQDEIDAYVQGNMNKAEKTAFEALLRQHPELRDETELLLSYKSHYDNKDIYELQKYLDSLRSEPPMDGHGPNRTSHWYIWLLSAAAAVLIAFCIYYFVKADSLLFHYEIKAGLADNNITDPTLIAQRLNNPSRGLNDRAMATDNPTFDKYDSLFHDLNLQFENMQRDESYSDFTNTAVDIILTREYSEKYEAPTLLLIARAKLLDSNPEKALLALESINPRSPYYCYALYYKSIAYAMEKEKKEALASLDQTACPEFEDAFDQLREKIMNPPKR